MTFPDTAQDIYVDLPPGLLVGDLWEGDILNQIVLRGFIPERTPVSQVTTATVSNNAADDVGVFIDGALVFVVAGASANATALLLETAIEGTAALAGILSGVAVAGDDFAISFSDFTVHTVTAYSPATADITPIVTAPTAVGQVKLDFGYAVVLDPSVVTANGSAIAEPSAIGQTVIGVLGRMPGNQITPEMLRLQGYDPDFLQPARAYPIPAKELGVVVCYEGTAPAPGDDVYVRMTGTGAGKLWGATDGAVSQVTQGDVEFVGVEVVGLAVDALPDLTVLSNTSDDQTAADLRDAWNASAQHLAAAAATIDTSGAESLIILSFVDDQVHTVVSVSPAAADVVAIVNTTAAVAAFAKQLPNSSWGAPSRTTTTPPVAFLRVDVHGN